MPSVGKLSKEACARRHDCKWVPGKGCRKAVRVHGTKNDNKKIVRSFGENLPVVQSSMEPSDLAKGFLKSWFRNHYTRDFSAFQDDAILALVAKMIVDQKTKADIEQNLIRHPPNGYTWTIAHSDSASQQQLTGVISTQLQEKYGLYSPDMNDMVYNALCYLACKTDKFKAHYDALLSMIAKNMRGTDYDATIALCTVISHSACLLVSSSLCTTKPS